MPADASLTSIDPSPFINQGHGGSDKEKRALKLVELIAKAKLVNSKLRIVEQKSDQDAEHPLIAPESDVSKLRKKGMMDPWRGVRRFLGVGSPPAAVLIDAPPPSSLAMMAATVTATTTAADATTSEPMNTLETMTTDEAVERIIFGNRKRPRPHGNGGSMMNVGEDDCKTKGSGSGIGGGRVSYAAAAAEARKTLYEMARKIDDVFRAVRQTSTPSKSLSSSLVAAEASSTNGRHGESWDDPPPPTSSSSTTEVVGARIERFLRRRWSRFDDSVCGGGGDDGDSNGGEVVGDGGGDVDGSNGGDRSASLPWTSRVNCMLALWVTCLRPDVKLTCNNSKMKNGVREKRDEHRILPRPFSPEGCPRFVILVDRILVRLHDIVEKEEDQVKDKGGEDNNGLVSLEGRCMALILQNVIDSVILNESERNDLGVGSGGEWYSIFYKFVTTGRRDLTSSRDVAALHEAVRPLIQRTGKGKQMRVPQ